MTPKLVVFQSWKKLKVLEKTVFRKKFPLIYLWRYNLQNGVRKFFEINGSWNIQLSVILRFRKIVILHKIINRTWLTKKQKNSAHRFGDNYLTDHLVKFLQNRIKPWRVGALRVCRCFPVNFAKFLIILFTENLWATASEQVTVYHYSTCRRQNR